MMRTSILSVACMLAAAASAQDTLRVQVHGAVVNAVTEQPVLEALVEWYDADGQRQAVNQTNSEGSYAFFVLTTGELELRVVENGYEAYSERLRITPGESAREFTIRLVPK
ncbi:MAG: carboxypeptidase regulatory-like domain-containing protein [Flavobacteriales bacterium]|nr:carboxypeptidase regulatory-like domain-containing protein [Flavobacteriales bacterium]